MFILRDLFAGQRTLDIASDQDIQQGIQTALRSISLTLPDLRRQAEAGRFTSERARLVWSAIRDVVPSG